MTDEVLDVLSFGTITAEARFANSSNATLLATVELDGISMSAVYKPESGERPLWDFPSGLWRREVAAYVVSEQQGLGLIPPTVSRDDGPFGPGSLQAFIDEDNENHYFTLRDDPAYADTFRALAAFDVVANNSDRKSGHVLADGERLWAIDHGLCFHVHPKLRTVIWEFAGEPLDAATRAGLEAIRDHPAPELHGLISPDEIDAMSERAGELLDHDALPYPDEDGPYPPYPWPLV